MITFGLIAEGRTDHKVLKNILIGYFDDRLGEKIRITENQPQEDATDFGDKGHHGSWTQVIKYCKSEDFVLGLDFLDFYIIQFDTDVVQELGIESTNDVAQLIQNTIDKLIESIGNEVFEQYRDKIFFAISVNSIECWLLPLYYRSKRASDTNNCLYKLNQNLPSGQKIQSKKSKKLFANF